MNTFFIILTSAIIFPIIIIGCLKALYEGGVNVLGRKPFSWCCKPTESFVYNTFPNTALQKTRDFAPSASTYNTDITLKPTFKSTLLSFGKIFIMAVLFRLATYFVSFLFLRTLIYPEGTFGLDILLRDYVRWDANNYIRIATLGYDGYYENGMATTLVFFPLYSWIMKLFQLFIPSIEACGLVVSTLCYGLGCSFLYGLVKEDFGKNIAKNSVILISVFPFAFFFGAIMPESTFFFTACACMYFARKRNFIASGIFGALASLSRMQGLLLAAFFVAQWLTAYKPFELIRTKNYKDLFNKILTKLSPVFIMPIGTLIYLYQNYWVTGDAFKFLEYQEAVWGQHAQYFGVTVADNFSRLSDVLYGGPQSICIWLPQFVLFFLCCATLIYGLNKVSSGYILFLVFYLIMNYTPSFLLSGGRYMSVAFPMFIILGIFFEKHPRLWEGAIVVSSLLYALYMGIYLNYGQVF